MRLIADTHIHVYPCYDIRKTLDSLRGNLAALDGRATCMAFLAERYDCRFFARATESPETSFARPLHAEVLDQALLIREQGWPDLFLFAGRQIVTRERIELLSLTTDRRIADGLPAADVLARIREGGGLPVISWSPGKWLGRRREVIARLLQENRGDTLLVGDTAMRPAGWPQSSLMRQAVRQGCTLIAGTDPLPFTGEESRAGRYASLFEADFEEQNPVASIRTILARPVTPPLSVGSRLGWFSVLRRVLNNAWSGKTG
jgi:hypothetical protein